MCNEVKYKKVILSDDVWNGRWLEDRCVWTRYFDINTA